MESSYSPLLVTLSCIIAALASYTALDLAGRVRTSTTTPAARCWLVGGAFSMGIGIWAMHFIGMLAFILPIPMGYDLPLTLLSLVAGVVASGIALAIVHAGKLNLHRLLVGGIAMGAGITTMHYVGMAAMKMEPATTYDPALFTCSFLIAVAASITALWIACRFNATDDSDITSPPTPLLRVGAAVVMAIAIAGMHYTGMAAARFSPDAHGMAASTLSPEHMAGVVASVAILIMLVTLALSVYDSYHTRETRSLASSLQAAHEELQFLLLHDPLTRLPNRLLLEDRVARIMAAARRKHVEFALFYIDLDRFKSVNDLLGHHIGDLLIKKAAQRIEASIRGMDTVARIGGDEFIIVLSEGETQQGIEQVAQRIGTALATMFDIEGHEIRISGSIGISIYPHHGLETRVLIAHANAAMYYAKDIGKNNYQVYEAGMSTAIEWRNKVAINLARTLERNELTLAYQPKVNIVTNSITGLEVLARWTDEELGTVGPQDFIPIAEDTGLILELGEYILTRACRQAREWIDEGLTSLELVAVNVSAYQLNHSRFVDRTAQILSETGLPAHHLELEVTESAIMQNPQRAGEILRALHNLGIKISIDDFGTGYSNLVQLKNFPIDHLKIDRSFISGVTTDIQDAELVKAIVALANNLNMAVIVEGVETPGQLEFVKALGVTHCQGYLFSKPLSAKDFRNLIVKNARSGEGPNYDNEVIAPL